MSTPRLAALAALLLSACEGELVVDLTDAPVDGASRVQLQLSAIELLASDGSVTTIEPDLTESFDMLDYRDGETLRVLGADGELDGTYIGLRLRFDDDDAYLRKDGSSVPIELLSAGDHASVDLTLDGSASVALIVDIDLRFSLTDAVDTLGVYQMVPVIRVVDADTAGSIEGTIDADAIADSDCREGRALGEGVAVYLYPDSGVTPADYYDDGSASTLVQPVGSADVAYVSASDRWIWRFAYVAPGSYTVAWTCEADAEHPREDDALLFRASADVTVTEAQTSSVEFP